MTDELNEGVINMPKTTTVNNRIAQNSIPISNINPNLRYATLGNNQKPLSSDFAKSVILKKQPNPPSKIGYMKNTISSNIKLQTQFLTNHTNISIFLM